MTDTATKTGEEALVNFIDISSVRISENNTRKISNDDRSIRELADNIKEVGLINPVTVRKHPGKPDKFELLAGFRRFIATSLAGFKTIKAEIIEADDQKALTIMVAENLQREDLKPLEEAEQLKLLLEHNKDVKAIASNLGRSPQWVARRAKLFDLTPEWLKAANKHPFDGWSAGHLELIARFEPDIQNALLKSFLEQEWLVEDWKIDDLKRALAENMHLLNKAPWKLDDESLLPERGACAACGRRSCHQPILFEDDLTEEKIKENDKCLDSECWNRKMASYLERRVAHLKDTFPNLLKVSNDGHHKDDDVLNEYSWRNAKKSDEGARPAVVVKGPGLGSLRWIIPESWAVKSRTFRERDADGKPKPSSLEERKVRLQGRRNSHIISAIKSTLAGGDDFNYPNFVKTIDNPFKFLACLAAVFGTENRRPTSDMNDWKAFEALSRQPDDKIIGELWPNLAGVFSSRLFIQNGAMATEKIPESKKICDLLLVDFNELQADAEKSIPVPKSWAKLEKIAETAEKITAAELRSKMIEDSLKAEKKSAVKAKRKVKRKSLLKTS
jgi:ParB/RepB/Spo0J family partition protein